MATVKLFLNTRYKSKEGTYPIVIRIIDKEKQLLHGVGYKVLKEQFKDGQVRKHTDAHLINSVIDTKLRQAKQYIADCRIRHKPVNFDMIFREEKSYSFIDYLRHRAKQYKEKGQFVMEMRVNGFAKELEKCFTQIYFDEISQDHLRTLESWLIGNRNAANTRAKKFSWLRMFFYNAITDGKASG